MRTNGEPDVGPSRERRIPGIYVQSPLITEEVALIVRKVLPLLDPEAGQIHEIEISGQLFGVQHLNPDILPLDCPDLSLCLGLGLLENGIMPCFNAVIVVDPQDGGAKLHLNVQIDSYQEVQALFKAESMALRQSEGFREDWAMFELENYDDAKLRRIFMERAGSPAGYQDRRFIDKVCSRAADEPGIVRRALEIRLKECLGQALTPGDLIFMRSDLGAHRFTGVDLRKTTVKLLDLRGCEIEGDVILDDTLVLDGVLLSDAQVAGDLSLKRTQLKWVDASGLRLDGGISGQTCNGITLILDRAVIGGDMEVSGSRFRTVLMDHACVQGDVGLDQMSNVTISQQGANIMGDCNIRGVRHGGLLNQDDAHIEGDVHTDDSHFTRYQSIGRHVGGSVHDIGIRVDEPDPRILLEIENLIKRVIRFFDRKRHIE